MYSTMGDAQLTITEILRHAERVHALSEVVTYHGATTTRRDYAEVGRRARTFAGALTSLGVRPGDRVATLCRNHAEHLEAYFAVPGIGAVLLTLNLRLSPDQLRYIVGEAAPEVLVVDAGLLDVAGPLLQAETPIKAVVVVGEAGSRTATHPSVLDYESLLADAKPVDWPGLDERQAAIMCYTTGTTGSPKGVVYSHRSTYLHALAISTPNVFDIGERDRALVVVPMFHATAWGIPYSAVLMGADQLMPGEYLQGEHLAAFAQRQRATFTAAVPAVLTDLHRAAVARRHDLSALRLVVGGGSTVPLGLIERWQEDLGVTLVQAWGMTETSPVAAIARPPKSDGGDLRRRAKTGRPVAGVELRVVDGEGNPVPLDGRTVGELEARGAWVTTGYYGGQGQDRFHHGWLRTGDVGHMDDEHYVQLTDRLKDVIKSGGEWISSLELENVLQSHLDVVEAGVIGVADERWQERPLACVVFRNTPDKDAFARLARHLEGRVPRWWIPERWAALPQLPRTSVGKIDKARLRRQYAQNQLNTEATRASGVRSPRRPR